MKIVNRWTNALILDTGDANLRGANLGGANLCGANLCGANLGGADLRGADLGGAENIPAYVNAITSILPAGDIIGYKKCIDDKIVFLLVESGTQRSNATGRKCRCEKALVLSVALPNGDFVESAMSKYSSSFVYTVGQYVCVSNFDKYRWNECSPGIHFYITLEEAEAD